MNKPNFKPTNKNQKQSTLTIATAEQKLEHYKLFCFDCTMLNYCKHKELCTYLHETNYTALHNAICLCEKVYCTAFYFCVHADTNQNKTATSNLADLLLCHANTLKHAFLMAKRECENRHDHYTWEMAKTFLRTFLEDASCFEEFCETTNCNFWN